jgi:hypothetical protein
MFKVSIPTWLLISDNANSTWWTGILSYKVDSIVKVFKNSSYAYVCTYIYMCMHVYIYTHTHTHTHIYICTHIYVYPNNSRIGILLRNANIILGCLLIFITIALTFKINIVFLNIDIYSRQPIRVTTHEKIQKKHLLNSFCGSIWRRHRPLNLGILFFWWAKQISRDLSDIILEEPENLSKQQDIYVSVTVCSPFHQSVLLYIDPGPSLKKRTKKLATDYNSNDMYKMKLSVLFPVIQLNTLDGLRPQEWIFWLTFRAKG